MTPTGSDLRALVKRGQLTGSAAARIAGVNARTFRRWIGGESVVPYSAYRVIEAHVEQAEMITDGEADHAAWIAEMDADTASRAPLAVLDEQIWTLTGIQQMQRSNLARLESDVDTERAALAETTRRLSTLIAERDKVAKA